MPAFNLKQRILLAIVAAIILLIQLAKFDQDGIEGSGWIIAMLASGLLLLPLFAPSEDNKVASSSPSGQEFGDVKGSRVPDELLLSAIDDVSASLWGKLPEWLLAGVSVESASDGSSFYELWRPVSHCYAYALVCATAYKSDLSFFEQGQDGRLGQALAPKIVAVYSQLSVASPSSKPLDIGHLQAEVLKDIIGARHAAVAFMRLLASRDSSPDSPLLDYLANALGVDARLRPKFDVNLRAFTKANLTALSALYPKASLS